MERMLDQPRLLGIFCTILAVGLGIAFLAAAGAPSRFIAINLAALVVGAAIWCGVRPRLSLHLKGAAVLALAAPLMATALFGAEVDGASRWVYLGPLSVQVSHIVLPAIVVLYARHTDGIGSAGILITATALAIQPDRAMAGALVAGIAAIALTRYSRFAAVALFATVTGFAAAMVQPDTLPAMPFVERILYTSFDVHLMAGLAVVIGCLVLLVPALSAFRCLSERTVLIAFGATWATVVAAAALGNYPTPVVGYGGSAIIGYLLSAALLPRSCENAGGNGHGGQLSA